MFLYVEAVNLPRGNKSYLHTVKKKVTRNFDSNILDEIQTAFNEERLSFIREEPHINTNYTTPNETRVPDFRFRVGKDVVVLEEDSYEHHGDFPYQNSRTRKRNMDHIRAGYGLSVLSRDLAKQLKLPLGPLAVYLYYHTIMLLEANNELRREWI